MYSCMVAAAQLSRLRYFVTGAAVALLVQYSLSLALFVCALVAVYDYLEPFVLQSRWVKSNRPVFH